MSSRDIETTEADFSEVRPALGPRGSLEALAVREESEPNWKAGRGVPGPQLQGGVSPLLREPGISLLPLRVFLSSNRCLVGQVLP